MRIAAIIPLMLCCCAIQAVEDDISVSVVNVGKPVLAVRAPSGGSPDARTRALLQGKVTVIWEEISLDEAVAQLGKLTSLRLVLAPQAAIESPPISLRLSGVSAGTVLDWVGRISGMQVSYINEGIWIGPEKARGKPSVRLYDVTDLSRPVPHFPGPNLGYAAEGGGNDFDLFRDLGAGEELERPSIEDLAELVEDHLRRRR